MFFEPLLNFSEWLRDVMFEKGISIRKLARLSGLSIGAIHEYKCGTTEPSYYAVFRIVSALDYTIGVVPNRR